MARIGVVGVGSIGSVLAHGFDALGHEVWINDLDGDREAAMEYRAAPKPTLARQCDVIIVAVPTPTTEHGGDYSAVDRALEPIAAAEADPTVCLRSTMPPGATGRLADKHGLDLVYSPEFLRDRSDVSDFFDPDRIVLSGPAHERGVIRSLLDEPEIDCDTWITTPDYLTAEIAKEAHNAFFAAKVSFANQMRVICEGAGADPQTVMDIVTADSRNTDSHLDPMLGPFGGKCLPKDLAALRHFANSEDLPTAMLDATQWINDIAQENYENVNIEGNWPNVSVQSD